ncbi:MAG: hypothetical protein ACJ75B_13095 [Flavisolibacter sp.]
MLKPTFLFFALLMLAGCTNHDRTNESSPITDSGKTGTTRNDKKKTEAAKLAAIADNDTTLRLEFFQSIPDTIDGCGEYFTYDTSKVKNDRYIFLSNLTDFAIIKIVGKNIYLKHDSTESREINDKKYIAVYKGEGYKVVLTMKQTKTYDEGGFYSGTMEISFGKKTSIFKIHGDSGC